jgi:hypothetical protein
MSEADKFIVPDQYDPASELWAEIIQELHDRYLKERPPYYAIGRSQNGPPSVLLYGQDADALGNALLSRGYTHIEMHPNFERKTGAELEEMNNDGNM